MMLAEEILHCTVEELIENYGARFAAVETWYGYEFQLRIGGTVVSTLGGDVPYDHYDRTFFDQDFGPDSGRPSQNELDRLMWSEILNEEDIDG